MFRIHQESFFKEPIVRKETKLAWPIPDTLTMLKSNEDSAINMDDSRKMAEKEKRLNKIRERNRGHAWLAAAQAARAPRFECAVFGCRSSSLDAALQFHAFPEDPERWKTWLKLIHRQDLADKLLAGRCDARVCSLHFAPGDLHGQPTLHLPVSSTQLVHAGPDEVKIESDEVNFEPESPPTSHDLPADDPLIPNIPPSITVSQPSPTTRREMATQTIDSPIKSEPEPNDFDFEIHKHSQTDSYEAFQRLATYSAVEQINIPPTARHDASVKHNSVASQTCHHLTEYFTKGIKKRLGDELEEANKRLKLAENPHLEKTQFIKGCDKYLDEKVANFIQSHAYLCDKFEGRNYTQAFKTFALKLYLRNPTAYKFVERFFNLPSREGMQRFKYPVTTGINETLMQFFEVKVEKMSVQGKMCVVCFDVVPLTRNLYYDVTNDYLWGMEDIDQVSGSALAEYAAVITVRGLYSRWKQPVSFAFLSQRRQCAELNAWLIKTIAVLLDLGLLVKALVTNSGDEFLGLTVDEDAPYFDVCGRKIYYIFDVPDLFKKARDQLMQHEFHIGEAIVKWDHVVNVYDTDKQQEMRLMPDITEQHVRPDLASKNLKLATQVFSNSVAAAMYFYFVAGIHDKKTKDTVQFITKMSILFDVLYSRTLAKAYRGAASQQQLLKEMIQYLKSIEVKNQEASVVTMFASGLIITIKSLMALMADQKKCNMKYIPTKNLSKDFMQVFFDGVKRFTRCERPTPIKFARAFRKQFFVNLLNSTIKGASGTDMNVSLVQITEYVKVDINKKSEPEESKCLAIGVRDYKVRWPSNEYIAGYLLWKCLERHSCPQLIRKLCEHCKFDIQDNPELLLETFRFYNAKNVGSTFVKKPPPTLTDFVGVMERRFEKYFSRHWNHQSFGRKLLEEMSGDTFVCPCVCFPLKFMKTLYVRLKIYDRLRSIDVLRWNKYIY